METIFSCKCFDVLHLTPRWMFMLTFLYFLWASIEKNKKKPHCVCFPAQCLPAVPSCWVIQKLTSPLLGFPQLSCKMSASPLPSSLAYFQSSLEICLLKGPLSPLALWDLGLNQPSGTWISQSAALKKKKKHSLISTSNSIPKELLLAHLSLHSIYSHAKKLLVFSPTYSFCPQIPPADALWTPAPTSPPGEVHMAQTQRNLSVLSP